MRRFIFFMFILVQMIQWYGFPRNKNIRFDHISIKEGLSQASVHCITQDDTGFMWFGTQEGLNRYDGYTFKVFSREEQNPNSLSHDFIYSLYKDGQGKIWIGTNGGGLVSYNPKTGKFTRYPYDHDTPDSLSHNRVYVIIEDQSGVLWVGTRGGGLNRLDRETGTFKHYTHDPKDPDGIDDNCVYALCQGPSGDLWVGTAKGLNRFNRETGRFKRYGMDGVFALCKDWSGMLWVGTGNDGLYRFDPNTGSTKHYSHKPGNRNTLSNNFVRVIFEDKKGMLWIGTNGGGMDRFDPASETFNHYVYDLYFPEGLTDNVVHSIYQDRTGILWVGTSGGGINKFNPGTEVFEHYTLDPVKSESLTSKDIAGVYECRSGFVWVGTASEGGLNRCDFKTGAVKQYFPEPGNPNSLNGKTVYAFYENPNRVGILWLGTDAGLQRLNIKTNEFRHYVHNPERADSLSSNGVLCLYGEPDGTLWMGTIDGGLNKFNTESKTGHFKHYRHEPDNPNSLSHNFVFFVYGDRSGMLWLGTAEGLNRFDPRTESFKCYLGEPGRAGMSKFISIHEDDRGTLWLGTLGGGLLNFDPKTEMVKSYGKKAGLLSSVVYGILGDNDGHLWLSSNKGIFKFNLHTEEFTQYIEDDGLQSNEFNVFSYHKGHSGRLYFGGINGLTAFYPSRIAGNPNAPAVVITDFQKFNEKVELNRPFPTLTSLKLSHHDHVFSFEFAALDFTAPGKNRYAYKMEGFDKKWLYTDAAKRFAVYTNLEPGEYTFKVKASNNNGVWNETGTALEIKIIPPYWQTWWFKFAAVLAGLALLFFIYRVRIRAVESRSRKLEAQVEARTEDLKLKKEELEKINNVVKAINREVDLSDILLSLIREIFESDENKRGRALVYDDTLKTFQCKACVSGSKTCTDCTSLSGDEVEKQYINGAQEIISNVFLSQAGDESTGNSLVIRIPAKDVTAGYLIFENLSDNDLTTDYSTEIVEHLRDHVVSAFIRSKLLMELKYANERAEAERNTADEANRSKSEFLARMSHEIRTPMNSVIGFTELMLDTDLNDEQLDYARTINRSAQALVTLINDILDFSKVESGLLTLEDIDFDPEVMAFDVCELMRPRIGVKQVEIICRIGDKVPPNVKGDPGRYRQILINLMGNAVKFTEKGEVELFIDVEKETRNTITLHASVKDTGIGIPAAKLDSVFDAFQQADGSTTRKYGGSGLGLAICKQIAKLMKGEISVESEPGKGSVFHFSAVLKKSGKKPVKPVTPESLTGKKVLIVDDNKNNLDILTHLLTAAGMEVVTLTRGKDVLPMLEIGNKTRSPFHLCILDIQMPDISGYEVARRIRRKGSPNPDLPLLAFTSSYSRRSRAFKSSGFDGFLPKPIQRARLIEMLEQILGKKRDRRQKRQDKELLTRHSIVDEAKQSTRILLAEDNPINQKLAKFILTKAGYQVEVVNNGKDAVDTYRIAPDDYDMIFMDVQMPEMNGIDASKRIRELGFDEVPIVAMTAQAMKGDRERCLAAGMNDYMAKPIKREMVFEMVKKWAFAKKGVSRPNT